MAEYRSPNLLGTSAYRHAVEQALASSREQIEVISAFASLSGVGWLIQHVPDGVGKLRILVRWSAADLITGFGNLDIYPTLAERGFELRMNPAIHAKLFLVDRAHLFVGSANLTSSGMGLERVTGNVEIGNACVATPGDVGVFDSAFADAALVTPELWAALKDWLAQQKLSDPIAASFPPLVEALMEIPVSGLWVTDLPWCSPEELRDHPDSDAAVHDRALLSAGEGANRVASIAGLPCARWLVARLADAPNHELYFGELSSCLHQVLLDDPRPYRSDVKSLLANLFAWVGDDPASGVIVDRPNHSQRARLSR